MILSSSLVLSTLADLSQVLPNEPNGLSRFFALILLTIVSGSIGFCIIGWALPRRLAAGSWVASAGILLAPALSLPPLLFFLFGLSGWPIPVYHVWTCILLLAGAGLVVFIYKLKARTPFFKFEAVNRNDILLIAMFLLAAAIRTVQVQDILVPNWIDGFTHYQITGKILANGAHPLHRIYPTGLHAGWITSSILLFSTSLEESGIVFTQWLSLISGLTFFSVLRQVISPRYALVAAGFYWFVTPFPAYLVSWGRYPLLMGMVLLPPVLWFAWQGRHHQPHAMPLAGLLLLALALTHYGTFFLACVLILAMWIVPVAPGELLKKFALNTIILPASIIVLPATLLGLRALIAMHTLDTTAAEPFAYLSVHNPRNAFYILSKTFQGAGGIVWLASAAALVYSTHKRHPWVMMLGFSLLILFLSHTVMLALLGTSLVNAPNLLITATIPTCALLGYLLQKADRWLANRHMLWLPEKIVYTFAAAIVLAIFTAGGQAQTSLIPEETILFDSNDQDAIYWIAANTNEEDTFLVNCSIYDSGSKCEPVDGGVWIKPMTGRPVVLLPGPVENFNTASALRESESCFIYSTGEEAPEDAGAVSPKLVFSSGDVYVYQVELQMKVAAP